MPAVGNPTAATIPVAAAKTAVLILVKGNSFLFARHARKEATTLVGVA
jgi:hypothetical protein